MMLDQSYYWYYESFKKKKNFSRSRFTASSNFSSSFAVLNLLVICLLLMSVVAAFTAIGSITTIPTTSTLSLRMFSSSSNSNSRTGALLLSSPSSLPLSSLALSSSSFDANDTPTASNITTDDTNDDGDDKNLSEIIAEQKKILLKAVGKGNINEILKAAQELEQHNWISSSVSGRWSLVFSTMSSSENKDASPLDDIMKNVATDASLPRKISDAIYKVLFRFLPALAGGQEQRTQHKKGNRNSSNSNSPFRVVNEQIVDTNTQIVINTVDLRLVGVRGRGRRSWGDDGVRICVRGTATPIVTTPSTTTTNDTTENNNENVLEIIFTETSIGPIPNFTTTTTTNNNKNSFLALLPRIQIPTVTLPLPRPVGIIRTTFCDNTVRLSRGSRGGLFVLKRIKD